MRLSITYSLIVDWQRFRGAAPLHHTLLAGRERTGVTVLTMHPTRFDCGDIIAQTPPPGFIHNCNTVPELIKRTSAEGAAILLQCIKQGAFVPPLERKGHSPHSVDIRFIPDAPKIKPQDRHVDWSTWTASQILRTHKAIGPLWNTTRLRDDEKITAQDQMKRVIWSSGFREADESFLSDVEPGLLYCKRDKIGTASTYVQTCDKKCLEVKEITIDGGQRSDPEGSAKHAGAFSGKPLQHIGSGEAANNIYALFHLPLT